MKQLESIMRLANRFSRLPGVGKKTALRYAYSVIEMSDEDARDFCDAIMDIKEKVHFCKECGGFTEKDICDICSRRDKTLLCVVAYPKDIVTMEKCAFTGVYHVLNGTLSPLDGRGPDELRIKELLKRLADVEEVIVATNPDVEGEATAVYLAKLIKPLGIKVTRIAQGISMGSDIEYADEITLTHALTLRTQI